MTVKRTSERAAPKPIRINGREDLPLMPASLGTMEFNPTGTWKYIEPYYQDKTPPCDADCPTGQDIVIQLTLSAEKRYDEALAILRRANPFPAVTGRVCPHPCESRCNRKEYGGTISIRRIERFLGDYGIARGVRYRPERKRSQRVAVVGAGPAGLTCAFYLGLKGYAVTVYESLPVVGGLLVTGIPDFRLPRSVFEAEMKIFDGLPVEFRTGARLGVDVMLEDLRKSYNAVFLAVGRYRSRRLGIEGEHLTGVVSGIDLLRRIKLGEPLDIGRRILVVGGGNTALDCARSLMRLGREVRVIYRRSDKEMPAFPDDIEESREEGVPIDYLTAPIRIRAGKHGELDVVCCRMTLGTPDASGRRSVAPMTNSEYLIRTETVVTALGEETDSEGFPPGMATPSKGIAISANGMTTMPNVFAGGDCAGGQGTVSDAIGRGRWGAEAIDAALEGRPFVRQTLTTLRGASEEIVGVEQLNGAYIAVRPGVDHRRIPPADRKSSFHEIEQALPEEEVVSEAARCIACGTCTACDNCRVFCPDVAVRFHENGGGYEIDYGHCKGCGICVKECPRSAMGMRRISAVKE